MYLFVEVIFHAGQRRNLPKTGYRPDAIFNKLGDYWGITFTELQVDKFDNPTLAIIKFTFQDCHYKEVLSLIHIWKTLKSWMIDEKIPRQEREEIWLLAEEKHILWIVGHRISAYYKITEQTKTILEVEFNGGKSSG